MGNIIKTFLKLLFLLVFTPFSASARLGLPEESAMREPIQALESQESGLRGFIRRKTRLAIRKLGVGNADAVFTAIMEESRRYGFDPVLIMAVIEHESGFGVLKRGTHGEIGLMQIKPRTARWIAERMGLPFAGPKSLENPVVNIRLGTAYLSLLRKEFPAQGFRFLTAYNMGASSAKRVFRHYSGMGKYSRLVMRRYFHYHSEFIQSGHLA
jgi:soluble lytic murein transglycosylase